MKCPHCLSAFHDNASITYLKRDRDADWGVRYRICPACSKIIVEMVIGTPQVNGPTKTLASVSTASLVYPKNYSRQPCPAEVPPALTQDYLEACQVLAVSPKASAALTRRALQTILRDYAGVKAGNLADEIQQAISSKKLPPYLEESIDAVRNIGNFAAHPLKSRHSGEIIEVEPGEAEWNLDVLESLFEFFFVQPEALKKKRALLDAKLKEAGKPPMK